MMSKSNGSRYVEVEPGVRVWVEDVGEGYPMVFLHGWPASYRMFEYQLDELPRHGIRCIAPDMRGFGASDKPWHGYDYDRLADDLGAVLDAFQLENVTLVGFSMGGAIAVRHVARDARRVAQLALVAAAVPSVTQRPDFPHGVDREACDDLIRLCQRDRPRMLATFASIFFHEPEALSPEFRAWFLGICAQASGHATIACCELFRDADLRADLPQIRLPTLILHGDADHVCKFDLATETQFAIPGSRLVTVDDAGHGLCYERRDVVNEELRALAQIGRRIQAEPRPWE
jgi:non-heme chloroperoxidase